VLDLSTSNGRLVFDVTPQGAGVEVFQPFDVVAGAHVLAETPVVNDGQSVVSLALVGLGAGDVVAFTIDVDDTVGQREITVSGSEIEGATVSYVTSSGTQSATFATNATATISLPTC
jgi:hypothetical protein